MNRPLLDSTIDLTIPSTASMFDEVSLWSSRFGILMLENLELRANLDVLDIGCGTGFPLFELAAVHGERCRFTGVDVWKDALRRAEAKAAWLRMNHIALVEADASQLPFPPRSFDLIVSNLGINNFADPAAVMAECSRVARDGSRLVITTNSRQHMTEVYAVFREVFERSFPHLLVPLEENVAHRSDRSEIEALFAGAGYGRLRFVESSFVMRFLDGSALLRHPLTRWFGWREMVPAAEFDAVFAAVELRLNELGEIRATVPMLYAEGVRQG